MCHEPSANLSLCANEVEDVLNDQKKKRQKKDEGEGPLNRCKSFYLKRRRCARKQTNEANEGKVKKPRRKGRWRFGDVRRNGARRTTEHAISLL